MTALLFIGIDVSKDTLEVASTAQTKSWQASNETSGIEALGLQLQALRPALVVLQASGAATSLRPLAHCGHLHWKWPWSIRARRAILPAPWGRLPKPTGLMRACSQPSLACCTSTPNGRACVKPLADAQMQRTSAAAYRPCQCAHEH